MLVKKNNLIVLLLISARMCSKSVLNVVITAVNQTTRNIIKAPQRKLHRGAIFPAVIVNRKYVLILFLPPAG